MIPPVITAVYPGTFDPITYGHVDLVRRAACIFPRVLVAVAEHTTKNTFFSLDERVSLVEQSLKSISTNIEVFGFQGLLVEWLRAHQATVIIRGIRAEPDFEYEFKMASVNRVLAPEIETVFLTPASQFAWISSSLVRELIHLGGDISAFVPAVVVETCKTHHKPY